MHFSSVLLLGASFVIAVVAQNIQFTQSPSLLGVAAGQPINLTWTGGDGSSAITITLKQGDPKNLQTVSIITGNAEGNSFTWTPSKSLPNADDYALMISQGTSDINYSGEFPLTGGAMSSSTTASPSSATSLSPASSSASSVSAALSSLNSTLSSILSSQSVVLVTTTIGTGASSVGTGIPMSRNTTFSSQTLTATTATTGGLQGGAPTTTVAETTVSTGTGGSSSTASASPTSGAAGLGSPLAFVLSAIAAMIYLN
ncbi:hypothetical protein MMC14_006977 [Varicellaria rhodocarpa]|nr:hypothetical protein [Varicellaria rhodocarpa]